MICSYKYSKEDIISADLIKFSVEEEVNELEGN